MSGRKFRVILSPSFSGSTLLSSLLNSLKSTASMGELHWTLDHPIERVWCSECLGKPCPIVRPLVTRRKQGRLNDVNLYPTVLNVTGRKNLWTSDKHQSNVTRFLPNGGDGAIILFKSPAQLLASGKRHNAPWVSAFGTGESIYPRIYANVMYWVQNWTQHVYFCDYNQLCKHPEIELKAIADFFSQEIKPGGLQYPPRDWHNLFGNSAWKGPHFQKQIKPDVRWKTELTQDEKQSIRSMNLTEAHSMLKRLAERSREGKRWSPSLR